MESIFCGPLITTKEDMYPIVIGIKRMIAGGDAVTEWNLVMATAMLAMIHRLLWLSSCRNGLSKAWLTPRNKTGYSTKMATLSPGNHVKKTYPGGIDVIHDFSMDITDGEFIVIVGLQGAANPL